MLAHELVQASGPEHAVPVLVDVDAVREARSLAVEADAERNGLVRSGGEDEVGVARVERQAMLPPAWSSAACSRPIVHSP